MKKLLLSFVLSLSFLVNAQTPPPCGFTPIVICEDDSDGFATFDLTFWDDFCNVTDFGPITYHLTQADADAGINAIATPTAYTNIANPQIIYRRAILNTDGSVITASDSIEVSANPTANLPTPLELCDDDGDETASFDLTVKDTEIMGGNVNWSVTYYETDADAQAQVNPILNPTQYTNTANPQTIYAVVTDLNTGCVGFTTLTIRVLPFASPTPSDQIPVLESCDDDNDGFSLFDLTVNDAIILNGEVGVTVAYYETEFDANVGINPIINPTNYVNIVPNNHTIFARVESGITGCFAVVNFDLVVYPAPVFFIDDISICEGESAVAATGVDPLSRIFEWSYNGQIIPEAISTSYTVTQEGNYTVTVSNTITGCSFSNSFTVSLQTGGDCDSTPEIVMQNGTFTICEGIFTDTGGVNSSYDNNENLTMTFCPETENGKVGLDFTYFATQNFLDVMTIYDGDSLAATVLGTFSGYNEAEEIGLIMASDNNTSGCLTISFTSDASGNTIGWEANISCFQPCQDITPTIDSTVPEANEDGIVVALNGEEVTFNGSATFSEDGTNATYIWDFGDGSEASGLSVTHTFTTNGSYEVTLVVQDTNPLGCEESISISVEVIDEIVSINDASYPKSFFTLEELIENVIAPEDAGVGNFVSQVNGNPADNETKNYGYFNRGSAQNFPFEEGIVLTTGRAFPGGNAYVPTGGGPGRVSFNNQQPGDVDLENALGAGAGSTNDAVFIKFNFIPLGDEISFRYILASEEYDGSTECNFADSFAFLLRELGATEYTNLAVLPDGTPVNVTNINDSGVCTSNPEFFEGYNIGETNYDGRTTVLTASAPVVPGTSYEIKLVIADDGDSIWDTAIFLEPFNLGNADVGFISVEAFNDFNNNGTKDNDETRFTNGSFTYEKNNDGVINVVNSSTGSFTIFSEDESDTYDITYTVNDEFANCFTQNITSFDDVSVLFGDVADIDFPVVDDQSCEDLAVYLINNWAPPRPGFTHDNFLYLENLGFNTITSGTVEFVVDPQLVYNSTFNVNPAYTITNTSTGFTVDFVNLQPGEVESIGISITCPVAVPLDEVVTNTATYLTDMNDLVASNNSSSLSEVVVGSWDPNDKMEAHGPAVVYDDFVTSDEWLYYTIRFQNLGTAEAIFVRIEDELDAQLDENTFQMLRSSHDYVVTRTGKDLEWFFEDIDLPAQQDDDEGSRGFVYFRIKPLAGYAVGDVIPNTAAIYFDFNAPVITNRYETEFIEPLSINDFDNLVLDIFPNPAKEKVNITLNSSIDNLEVSLVDLQGKLISVPRVDHNNSVVLNVSSLNSGLYFLHLRMGNKTVVEKLVIE